jgi:hypothetical protein
LAYAATGEADHEAGLLGLPVALHDALTETDAPGLGLGTDELP